jgi:small-conductance mechanosensitive channel
VTTSASHIFYLAAFIGGAVILGIVIERIVVRYIRLIAERRNWRITAEAMKSLSGFITIWFLLAAVEMQLEDLTASPKSLVIGGQVIMVLGILTITFFLMRLAVGLIKAITFSEKDETIGKTTILVNLTRLLILLLGLLFIFNSLGISITPLITALGIGGLAVSLALQDTLSNLFAGIQVAAMKEINVGDVIRLSNGNEGTITDIGWRVTTVRTFSNSLLVIPNSKLSTDILTNYSLPGDEHRVIMHLPLAFGTDLPKAESAAAAALHSVITHNKGALPDPPPAVRFTGYGEFGIQMTVSFQTVTFSDAAVIRHEVIKAVDQAFRTEGIDYGNVSSSPNPFRRTGAGT